MALTVHAGIHVFTGDFAAADALSEEANGVSAAIGSPDVPYARLTLAAWRGHEPEMSELVEARVRDAAARGEGRTLAASDYGGATLYNGLGRYEDALAAAQQAVEYPGELGFSTWAVVELIEAAIRSGKSELAGDTLERLAGTTRLTGTEWARGIEARSRALLSEGPAAEDRYREAIDRLGRTRVRTDLARAHLLYGEWLRRERRRLEARDQLRTAYGMFASMGADAFADRAARELLATGETARKRTAETTDELTAQETQIARLARDGLSNPEIGARLFISPRTVQYHLHKVFGKLGISSRNELDRVLPLDTGAASDTTAS
jgi:DNA-binding CsgD family transcriptional regulator